MFENGVRTQKLSAFFCVFLDRLSRSNISNEIDLGFAWIDVVLSIFIIIMRSCDSGYSGTLEMFCLRTRRFESCRTRFCPWRTGKSETNKMRCFRAKFGLWSSWITVRPYLYRKSRKLRTPATWWDYCHFIYPKSSGGILCVVVITVKTQTKNNSKNHHHHHHLHHNQEYP